MIDTEKNAGSEVTSVLSRHTDEYNLLIARSNPTSQFTDHGHQLKKGLDARHVTMIAIGGALGTGLLIGTGSALRTAGPASILIAYSAIGMVVYMVMCGLGEVATLFH